jgi:hypothetical protein
MPAVVDEWDEVTCVDCWGSGRSAIEFDGLCMFCSGNGTRYVRVPDEDEDEEDDEDATFGAGPGSADKVE